MDKHRNPSADAWFDEIISDFSRFPFAFCYDGALIRGFAGDRLTPIARSDEALDADRTRVTASWRVDDMLVVRLAAVHDRLYGETEFTVYFENDSDRPSGLISDARAIYRFPGAYPCLKGIMGDHTNWYRPYALDVGAMPRHFESNSGRATHVCFPYFDLECGDGGVMLAIGWAGTWRADFRYDPLYGDTAVTLGSVNGLRTRLLPGETIRTALFVCARYTVRDENWATNYWRRWFVERSLPRADASGAPLQPFSTTCLASDTGRPNSDGSISETYETWRPSIEKMLAEDVHIDFRWFDAGWYIAPDLTSPVSEWWGTVGTWQLDPVKWPGKTFLESTDFARAHGMKTLMWFEPERVTDVDNMVKNFGYKREWGIVREDPSKTAGADDPEKAREMKYRQHVSNNIGDPACYRYTVDRIVRTLRENKVEMYREDNNADPAALWRYLDAREGEGRRGITECKFISAHYAMWDEIIAATKSYGGCAFVDSCASGGGRNDLESLRRGIPLLRSDYDRTSTAIRLSMTTAFNRWVPFCGAINKEKLSQLAPKGTLDMYVWRASYLAALNVDSQYVQDPDQDWDTLRRGLNEWKRLSRYILRDMYVFTPWHTEEETTGFTAYAWFDPDAREGALLAFRQEKCDEAALPLSLPFAGDGDVCVLTDEDTGAEISLSGVEARRIGLNLTFAAPRTARLIWIRLRSAQEG